MERANITFLQDWLLSPSRKPLIIRGARQVGKTWLVRDFAKKSNKTLIEFNFEKQPKVFDLFESNNPKEIVSRLGVFLNKEIDIKNSLLFLDEIQSAPEMLAKLRWFAEELPELPLIAAGSLLEFVLEKPSFSIPVGRIGYMYLEPFSFYEFLLAKDNKQLLEYIQHYRLTTEIPRVIHNQLNELFKEYVVIGGMPAVVKTWITENSLQRVHQISHDLLSTYREDFAKYKGRLSLEKLDEVLASIPLQLGQKFIYSRVDKEVNLSSIKQALSLLTKALVAHKVVSTAANGIPLGAEINEKNFKVIFLDVGLCSTALGLNLNQIKSMSDILLINKGGIAEQVVGQLLRTIDPPYLTPQLFYWQREKKGSEAEIDYVLQFQKQIVPLEVKAGSTGSLKSLHHFVDLKKLNLAVRINSDVPSITPVKVQNHSGKLVEYILLSLPFYLVGELPRLLEIAFAEIDEITN